MNTPALSQSLTQADNKGHILCRGGGGGGGGGGADPLALTRWVPNILASWQPQHHEPTGEDIWHPRYTPNAVSYMSDLPCVRSGGPSTGHGLLILNPFTPDSAKSIIEKQTAAQESTACQLSNEWSHFRVLSIESNVRKLCITQAFTLGVKG